MSMQIESTINQKEGKLERQGNLFPYYLFAVAKLFTLLILLRSRIDGTS
jgi:hypothetical protein